VTIYSTSALRTDWEDHRRTGLIVRPSRDLTKGKPTMPNFTVGKYLDAIGKARAHKGGPVLIECRISNDDASPELISWGSRVARANARPFRD
jgi:hypothetical protein